MSLKRLSGIFVLASGGSMLFALVYELASYISNKTDTLSEQSIMLFSFVGFLLLGIGHWLILQSRTTEQPINQS
jgi:hypothetical protein